MTNNDAPAPARAPRPAFLLADVVRVVGDFAVGIIEQITGTPAAPAYVVRLHSGAELVTDPEGIELVTDRQTVTDMRGDVRQLAAGRSDNYAAALRVLAARQRAEVYARTDRETIAGVTFVPLPAELLTPNRLTTLDGRFELVERFGGWRVIRHAHHLPSAIDRYEIVFGGGGGESVLTCAAYVAKQLGLDDPQADIAPSPEQVEAVNLARLRTWMRRHGLLDLRVAMTAERILGARAIDEREAHRINDSDHLRAARLTPEHDAAHSYRPNSHDGAYCVFPVGAGLQCGQGESSPCHVQR